MQNVPVSYEYILHFVAYRLNEKCRHGSTDINPLKYIVLQSLYTFGRELYTVVTCSYNCEWTFEHRNRATFIRNSFRQIQKSDFSKGQLSYNNTTVCITVTFN